MANRENSRDYLSIFLQDTPLMDVRAPVEFNQGSFPHAQNLPLLNDQQRQQIGIRYKEAGEKAAIDLGLSLATPAIRAKRLAAWAEFCEQNPSGFLYCFRGGLRSKTTQAWLSAQGIDYPLIQGGYKAMRRYLLQQFQHLVAQKEFILLTGPTGSGKTQLLTELDNQINLEALAHHRGSAFGKTPGSQPAQIDFENQLAVQLLKLHHGKLTDLPIVIEDESRLIGRIHLPPPLQTIMKTAPILQLTAPLEFRVNTIYQDYVVAMASAYQEAHSDDQEPFRQFVLGNLHRIRRRLGGERYHRIYTQFYGGLEALANQRMSASAGYFKQGIRTLLTEYYDPMYEYQLGQREGARLMRGDHQTLRTWLKDFERQTKGLQNP